MTMRNPGDDDVPSVDLSRFDSEFENAPVEEKGEFEPVPDGKYGENENIYFNRRIVLDEGAAGAGGVSHGVDAKDDIPF